jgi:O-antigen/teichoic acid export membrane protein
MRSNIKYVAGSFIWSSIATVLNAALKFISIPLLLKYFGKDNFGLITLAISANAYMQLLNMGMNIGAVKFFSQWIAIKDYDRINRVTRTNLTIYIGLGIINSIVLLVLAWIGGSVFNITPAEFSTFRYLLYILAGVSIVNWTTFVFNQLLVADEKIAFTQKILSVRNILNLAIVLLTILFKWTIIQYFLYDSIISMLVIVPYYWESKHRNLIQSILPGFYWKDFSVVFKYSLAIFAMGIFQITATQSRPLILVMFSDQGASILSDYRVVEVFPIFIISIGSMLVSILLPKTSKAIQQNNRKLIEKMAYEGTKYTSILVAFLCFPIMLNSKELLTLYVGDSYSNLSIWLSLWVFTLTLFLHSTPVASLVLATGKTRILVFSSAISCIISIVINAILCTKYGVGSAVIGYLVYIIIQMSFYYFYFNKKVLGLDSLKIFTSFIIPTAIGFCLMYAIHFLNIEMDSLIIKIGIKSLLWASGYFVILIIFKIIDARELYAIVRNKA